MERKAELADSIDMRKLVVKLYVQVFGFLCHSMRYFIKWKTRFLASLSANFYDDKVKKMVDDMQRTVKRIRDEATLAAETRLRDLGDEFRKMGRSVAAVEDGVRRLDVTLSDLMVVGDSSRAETVEETDAKLGSAGLRLVGILGRHAVVYLGSVEEDVQHGKYRSWLGQCTHCLVSRR